MEITIRQEDFEQMPDDLRKMLSTFIFGQLSKEKINEDNYQGLDGYTWKKMNALYGKGPANFGRVINFPHVIPIEAACSVVDGLNEASLNVFKAIIFPKTEIGKEYDDGELLEITKVFKPDRNALANILGSAGAINGTIGSINRRFLHRFQSGIYNVIKGPSLITHYGHGGGMYEINNGVQASGFEFEDTHAVPFRIAIWLREKDISLEYGDVKVTLKSCGKPIDLNLNSSAYRSFLEGNGHVAQYREDKKELAVFVMCTNSPCTAIQFNNGSIKTAQIEKASQTSKRFLENFADNTFAGSVDEADFGFPKPTQRTSAKTKYDEGK